MINTLINSLSDDVPFNGSRVVVQEYITRPLLIGDRKFDVRLYLLVSSVDPLELFIFNEGIVSICSEKFTMDTDQMSNKFVHLSNYSVNKNHESYSVKEQRWKLSQLWKYLSTEHGLDPVKVWEKTKDVALKAVLCGLEKIREESREKIDNQYKCFKLLNVDIMYDEDLKPWLMEVKIHFLLISLLIS